MSVLTLRLAIAHALLVPILVVAVLDYYWCGATPGVWLFPVGALLMWLAMSELQSMLAAPLGGLTLPQLIPAAFVATCCIAWPVYRPLWLVTANDHLREQTAGLWPFCLITAITLSLALLMLTEMSRFREPTGDAVRRLAGGTLTIVYVIVPLAFLVGLRTLGGNQPGMLALVSLVWVVKVSDSGAYFTGVCWGRRKLAPRLSPQKTWEGFIGGLAAAAVAAAVAYAVLRPWLCTTVSPANWHDAARWVASGVALGGVGAVGDLAESLLKRDVARKDSGNWLPGLGGALDVLDSLLWAAPLHYAFWSLGWLRP